MSEASTTSALISSVETVQLSILQTPPPSTATSTSTTTLRALPVPMMMSDVRSMLTDP
jgi:hypothetical protein